MRGLINTIAKTQVGFSIDHSSYKKVHSFRVHTVARPHEQSFLARRKDIPPFAKKQKNEFLQLQGDENQIKNKSITLTRETDITKMKNIVMKSKQ